MYHIGVCYEPNVEQLKRAKIEGTKVWLVDNRAKALFPSRNRQFSDVIRFSVQIISASLLNQKELGEVLLGPKEIRINVSGYVIASNQTTAKKQTKSCCFVRNVI